MVGWGRRNIVCGKRWTCTLLLSQIKYFKRISSGISLSAMTSVFSIAHNRLPWSFSLQATLILVAWFVVSSNTIYSPGYIMGSKDKWRCMTQTNIISSAYGRLYNLRCRTWCWELLRDAYESKRITKRNDFDPRSKLFTTGTLNPLHPYIPACTYISKHFIMWA